LAHRLRHLGHFILVNKAVPVGIDAGETILILLLAHGGKLLLADLAVSIRVHAFEKFGDACGRVTSRSSGAAWSSGRWWRSTFWWWAFGRILRDGEAGEAQEAEPAKECFSEFHVVREFG
jgi:hypothetical protein